MENQVFIPMTAEQSLRLQDLCSVVKKAAESGAPGSLMAQVYPDEDQRGGFFVCRFIPGGDVRKMYKALGLEPPGEP